MHTLDWQKINIELLEQMVAIPSTSGNERPLALFLKESGEKVRKDETYFKQFLEGRYGTDIVPEPMR